MPRSTPARRAPLVHQLVGLAAVALLALAACAAHEKAGDKAAALGDWRTAEREYGEAARKDPEKKDLQAKWREAKGAALRETVRHARACAAGQDWECALGEAQYGLSLDAGAAELQVIRRDAGRGAGFLRVRRAEETSGRGDAAGALGLLASAAEASDDPGLALEIRRVSPRVVAGAVAEADKLLAAGQFQPAIDLYGRAAQLDPGVRPRLDAARAAYERWKDGEAERLAGEGDGHLDARRFAEARASYDGAAHLRPQGRAGPLARYAGLLADGEARARKRDWDGATRAFGEAAQQPPERERGLAAPMLESVRVRPYAIVVRSVLVRPVRPDGYPWAGGRSRDLERALSLLRGADPRAAVPVGVALDLARRVPRENLPDLVVQVALPDGRFAESGPTRGVFADVNGHVVVLANAWDDRPISIRVSHLVAPGQPLEAGVVTFRLGELVTRGELALQDASIAEVRVQATPSREPEGTLAGLRPVADEGNLATRWSAPAPNARGWRITRVKATLGAAEVAPGAPAPSLWVEVEQRGQVVFRTPEQPARGATWQPRAAFLFAADDEQVVVRLLARGAGGVVALAGQPFTGRALASRGVDLSTPKGTVVRLELEARAGR